MSLYLSRSNFAACVDNEDMVLMLMVYIVVRFSSAEPLHSSTATPSMKPGAIDFGHFDQVRVVEELWGPAVFP